MCCSAILATGLAPVFAHGSSSAPAFEHFVVRKGDRLFEGDQEYRFVSFNIPCLHYIEDDMRFDEPMPFRFPDPYEIDDALKTIQIIGGRVARTYTLSVRRKMDWDTRSVHVTGPGQFNEAAFVALDEVIASANRHGVRLIIPVVNGAIWWGGHGEYAAFRGKKADAFFSDPELIADFKLTLDFLLKRVNTVTGVPYREDKAILAWETANEIGSPIEWTREVTAYMKQLDPNHLVIDGCYYRDGTEPLLREESVENPFVDFVQTHHYEKDPAQIIRNIRRNAAMAKGRKPYHIGEVGFLSTAATGAVIDAAMELDLSGVLIWSLRRHYRDGGFFWHHEPGLGGDFFKAYHFPGFSSGAAYDEKALMTLIRNKAHEIQGLTVPALPVPEAPVLLPIAHVGAISWRGSAGASRYVVERAASPEGPWTTLTREASDADAQYFPLFNDETVTPGTKVFYRVAAANDSGVSDYSGVVGPVEVQNRVFIDDMRNLYRAFDRIGKPRIDSSKARKFKEASFRIAGAAGDGLVYYVDGNIAAVRIFAFSEGPDCAIEASVGADLEQLKPVALNSRSFPGSEDFYGYWVPHLMEAEFGPSDGAYLKLIFQNELQLSRIEIEYR
jgi:hypothetical protein